MPRKSEDAHRGTMPAKLSQLEGGYTPRTCQWIEGNPVDRDFCGADTKPRSSYCPEHHARCYTDAAKNELKAKMIKLSGEGLSRSQIARELGLSKGRVSGVLYRNKEAT